MERGGGAGGMRMLSDTGIEENTLAILDSSGIKDAKDEIDDSKCSNDFVTHRYKNNWTSAFLTLSIG